MDNDFPNGVHVVAVTDTDRVVRMDEIPTIYLWAAAVPQDEAVAAVRALVPKSWYATLTERRLTSQQIAKLGLRAGDIRQIT
jgi:hypothetical protein